MIFGDFDSYRTGEHSNIPSNLSNWQRSGALRMHMNNISPDINFMIGRPRVRYNQVLLDIKRGWTRVNVVASIRVSKRVLTPWQMLSRGRSTNNPYFRGHSG
jgi:hypothetical protein